jgi:hypothetical protein
MRLLVVLFALAMAAPAAAQDLTGFNASQLEDLRVQQQLSQQRAVALHNELMALESRLRTEQAISDLRVQSAPVRLPTPPYPQAGAPASIDTSRLPAIPDAALAASNRRVRDAANNRR